MVRAHLDQCPQCRQDFQETALAGAAYRQHVSEEALVDYVFSGPAATPEREMIESHLALCAQCAEQLSLAQESRGLMEAGHTVTRFEPPRAREASPMLKWSVRAWQYGAVAASLIGLVALCGLWWSWHQTRELRGALTEEQRARQAQIKSLQADNEQLRQGQKPPQPQTGGDQAQQEIVRLRARVKELSAPQVNVPVLDVFPQELAQRTLGGKVNQLQIPRGARVVTLILNSQTASESKSYSLEILDERHNAVWKQQGLVRHSTGDYTINIPADLLAPGDYTFNVYGHAGGKNVKVETYRIRLEKR